jgi:hypothetical protein
MKPMKYSVWSVNYFCDIRQDIIAYFDDLRLAVDYVYHMAEKGEPCAIYDRTTDVKIDLEDVAL